MAGFNTLPTKEGGSGGSVTATTSNVPVLATSSLPAYWANNQTDYKEGYASHPNGAIELPSSSTAALTHYDASGSTVWTKANPGTALAGYDTWVGFYLDNDAVLLYVWLRETGTTPNTYALISINSLGTVATIGTDQPGVDFTADCAYLSGSSISPDGSGGFKILNSVNDPTAQYAAIDSAGQFTTQPTTLYTNAQLGCQAVIYPYETADGLIPSDALLSVANGVSGVSMALHNKTNGGISVQLPPSSLPLAPSGGTGFMRWRDYITFVDSAGNHGFTLKTTPTQFDTYIKQLAAYIGLSQ